MGLYRRKRAPEVRKQLAMSWVVIYDPTVYEAKPYYVELQFDDRSGPGGPSEFFVTEQAAREYAEERAAVSRRREELRKEIRLVMRIEI